jgi:hypothetical protein
MEFFQVNMSLVLLDEFIVAMVSSPPLPRTWISRIRAMSGLTISYQLAQCITRILPRFPRLELIFLITASDVATHGFQWMVDFVLARSRVAGWLLILAFLARGAWLHTNTVHARARISAWVKLTMEWIDKRFDVREEIADL